jgi:hypothetical protein
MPFRQLRSQANQALIRRLLGTGLKRGGDASECARQIILGPVFDVRQVIAQPDPKHVSGRRGLHKETRARKYIGLGAQLTADGIHVTGCKPPPDHLFLIAIANNEDEAILASHVVKLPPMVSDELRDLFIQTVFRSEKQSTVDWKPGVSVPFKFRERRDELSQSAYRLHHRHYGNDRTRVRINGQAASSSPVRRSGVDVRAQARCEGSGGGRKHRRIKLAQEGSGPRLRNDLLS